MPDVSSTAPVETTTWVALDVHKNSIVAGVLPAAGSKPQFIQIENAERSIRKLIRRPGGPEGLAAALAARGLTLARSRSRVARYSSQEP